MKAKILYILSLYVCLSFACTVLASEQSTFGIVSKCFSGNTFQLQDRRVVRLAGIEAPSLGKEGKHAQYYARNAKDILKNLVMGHKVAIACPGKKKCDVNGRYIAEARLVEDDKSINEYMVEKGAAYYFSHQDLGPELQAKLLSLQNEAILERRGFWEYLLSLPAASEPYTGNRQTMRFYPASCPESHAIKPRNRINFGSLMDAFMAGYSPANICQFWPTEPR